MQIFNHDLSIYLHVQRFLTVVGIGETFLLNNFGKLILAVSAEPGHVQAAHQRCP